jgi:hypothetical protein
MATLLFCRKEVSRIPAKPHQSEDGKQVKSDDCRARYRLRIRA